MRTIDLLAEIEDKLTGSPLVHLGLIAHGWTTMRPETCDLCWIVARIREHLQTG